MFSWFFKLLQVEYYFPGLLLKLNSVCMHECECVIVGWVIIIIVDVEFRFSRLLFVAHGTCEQLGGEGGYIKSNFDFHLLIVLAQRLQTRHS